MVREIWELLFGKETTRWLKETPGEAHGGLSGRRSRFLHLLHIVDFEWHPMDGLGWQR